MRMEILNPEKINSLAKDDLDELLANLYEQGKLEEVKYLLNSSEIVNKPSLKKTAYYPLSAAARGGQIEVLHYLLNRKILKKLVCPLLTKVRTWSGAEASRHNYGLRARIRHIN